MNTGSLCFDAGKNLSISLIASEHIEHQSNLAKIILWPKINLAFRYNGIPSGLFSEVRNKRKNRGKIMDKILRQTDYLFIIARIDNFYLKWLRNNYIL